MTIHKQYPPRDYETFADDTPAESDRLVANPPTSISQQQSDSDKSRSAAFEAQRLASQGSWADTFVGGSGTPATNPTPAASTVDDCEEARKAQYSSSHSHILQEPNDTLDPPPIYTPSDTTVSSPLMARSEPPPLPMPAYAYEPEQVSGPGPAPVPFLSSAVSHPHLRSQCPPQHDNEHCCGNHDANPLNDDDDDDDGALLPEPVLHQSHLDSPCHQRATVLEHLRPSSGRRTSKRRGCRGNRRHRGCGGRRQGGGRGCCDQEKARRFKRTCFFVFALVLCLWLLIPGLLKAHFNV